MPNLYFIVFDQAEVLDFSGPFDVFSMARIANENLANAYQLHLVSADGKPIAGIHGFKVIADAALADITPGPRDVVFYPGGTTDVIKAIGASAEPSLEAVTEKQAKLVKDCAEIVAWTRGPAQNAGILATICVGAFFGAKAGIFDGKKATTHHRFLDTLSEWTGDATEVVRGERYVMNDQPEGPFIMSSAGVSAGIDLSFAMLDLMIGPAATEKTVALMEYHRTINVDLTPPKLPLDLQFQRKEG